MSEVQALLEQYAEQGSEAAFRELVDRYVDFVYSSAVRLVGGDVHLAEDVTQSVFLHLSRNARKLAKAQFLGGWLHRTTCNIASNLVRSERRRLARERDAALMDSDDSKSNLDEIAPVLDEVINQLGTQDRTAIVLRFFERQDYRAIAAATGSTEDATRMRINRALDRMKSMLERRGVAISAAGLAAVLTTQAVSAAPAGLAIGVTAKVIAASAASGGASLLKLIIMSKAKTGVVSAILAAGLAVPWVFQDREASRLREQNVTLSRRAGELAQISADNERLSKALERPVAQSLPSNQLDELLRLRNEAGMQMDELKKLRAKVASAREQRAAQEQAVKSYFPRESWGTADLSTPEGAIQWTLNMTLTHRDLKSVLTVLRPEEREALQKYLVGRSEAELDAEIAKEADRLSEADGIRFVNTEALTNGALRVYYVTFKNHGTNDHWNASDLHLTREGWRPFSH